MDLFHWIGQLILAVLMVLASAIFIHESPEAIDDNLFVMDGTRSPFRSRKRLDLRKTGTTGAVAGSSKSSDTSSESQHATAPIVVVKEVENTSVLVGPPCLSLFGRQTVTNLCQEVKAKADQRFNECWSYHLMYEEALFMALQAKWKSENIEDPAQRRRFALDRLFGIMDVSKPIYTLPTDFCVLLFDPTSEVARRVAESKCKRVCINYFAYLFNLNTHKIKELKAEFVMRLKTPTT